MKAIYFEKYGSPEKVMSLKDIPIPKPNPKEVRIKIKATTVNDYDWSIVRGKPWVYRLMFGLFKPKNRIAGMELSGIVDEIGSRVKALNVGDAVFGDISENGFGTFAEYICIDEKALLKKPVELSFEEAAAIPHAAALAWQALRDIGNMEEGQGILINGGGGGVGTIGLQLAKLKNCIVTGVDTQEKSLMMKSIGYDHTIDYKKMDFTRTGQQYDIILDCKTTRSAFAYLKALNPNGIYVSIGGTPFTLIKLLFWSKIVSLFSSKKLQILGLKANKGLTEICDLVKQNKLKCEIDGPYPLTDTPILIQYFGEGKHKGKIVIQNGKQAID